MNNWFLWKDFKTEKIISLFNPICGIKYLNDCDCKKYLTSVEDRETTVYSLEAHTIGNPAYISTYPNCDFVAEGSSLAVGLYQLPKNSVLEYSS